MPLGIIIFIAWLAFMTLTVAAFVVWAWREKQYTSEANYRMLIDKEPEPWPGREKKGKPGGENESQGES